MRGFGQIDDPSIRAALETTSRQYFVGNLSRPQVLPFVRDERVEIGITSYQSATSEPAHRHSAATEYQFVASGWTQYLDTETGELHEYRAGDFYVIHPGTSYAQRSKAGTRILFIKVPSVNDKQLVQTSPEVEQWLIGKPRTVRTDYFHDPDAPAANSVRPAAAVVLLDDLGRVLLLRRADSGKWALPGGTLEMDESLIDCALREVTEESGLQTEITDLIGTYTDPDVRVAYSDGEVRREFTIVFAGRVIGGHVALDAESTEFRWVTFDEAKALQMADSQRRRLVDAARHGATGARHFG